MPYQALASFLAKDLNAANKKLQKKDEVIDCLGRQQVEHQDLINRQVIRIAELENRLVDQVFRLDVAYDNYGALQRDFLRLRASVSRARELERRTKRKLPDSFRRLMERTVAETRAEFEREEAVSETSSEDEITLMAEEEYNEEELI
ncbi:MAG: hypothetical protein ACPGYT_14985 [Nitrospirales bacterium]